MTNPSRLLRAALLVSTCGLSVPAFAQEASQLPPVDIAAEAAPAPDRIATAPLAGGELAREDLRRRQSGSSDTADLLRWVPGVSVNGGGGFSSMPAIRGLSEQRLTVLVDGQAIDQSCPNDMNSPMSYTDPQTVQQVRVVTGVSPVSMGGDAIGGVISVASAAPRFATGPGTLVTGEASAFYRSNADGFGGALSLTVADETLSATYTGSYTRSDQYEGGGKDNRVRSTEFAKTDHALTLALQTATGLLKLKGGYHFSPYEGFANQYMDMVSNTSWFVNAGYEGVYDWGTVTASADYRDTDHAMDFLEDKRPGTMPMLTQVHSFNAALKFDLAVSPRDTLRLGGEFRHQWLNDVWPAVAGSMMMGPNPYININGAKRDRLGLYGEWETHWSDRLSTLVGLRMDRVAMNTGDVQPYGTGMMNMDDAMAAMAFNAASHRRRDTNWSGSALVSYAPTDSLSLELGYAHKVRSPNIYERYSWGRGSMASRMIGWYGDGNGYVGNLALKPERADTVSAALELSGGAAGWSLRIAPYYTHVDDYIDAAFVKDFTTMMGLPSGFVQLQFANQKADFHGVDVSGELPLWRGANGDGTRLSASLAYLRGRNRSDGGALYHQMPLDVKLGVEHRKGAFEAGLDVEWVAEKDRVDATRHEPRSDDYALVNLRVAYTLAGVRLSAEAANLLDKRYDLPLGGVSLGDYKATGSLRPVPGRGRSLNLGLSTSF